LTGQGYANLHTLQNGGGEIRGQVMWTKYNTTLADTTSPTVQKGTCTITVSGREIHYQFDWNNVSGGVTGARFGAGGTVHTFDTDLTNPSEGAFGGNSGSASGVIQADRKLLNAIVDGGCKAILLTPNSGQLGSEISGTLRPAL
jgi:hypothetical protein